MANRLYTDQRYEEWLADMRRLFRSPVIVLVPTRYGCEVWECGTDTLLAELDYTVVGEEERVRY